MLSNLLFLLTFKEGISNSYFDFRGVASPMIFQDSTPMSSLMCAAQDSPQPRPLRGEKHPFPSRSSCASMRCLCRPNWVCFFFSAFPQFLASTSLEWRQNQFSLSWGLTAAPGFAHNRLTRLQQGRQPVSLVLLLYLAPKTAHRPSRGRIHFFSPERVYPPPLGGGAGYLLSWVRRVCPARSKLTHTGPTGLV